MIPDGTLRWLNSLDIKIMGKRKKYKVLISLVTEYSTIVEAESEAAAIEEALNREAPSHLACYDELRPYEWTPECLMEFPNLGKNETPNVEEV